MRLIPTTMAICFPEWLILIPYSQGITAVKKWMASMGWRKGVKLAHWRWTMARLSGHPNLLFLSAAARPGGVTFSGRHLSLFFADGLRMSWWQTQLVL